MMHLVELDNNILTSNVTIIIIISMINVDIKGDMLVITNIYFNNCYC